MDFKEKSESLAEKMNRLTAKFADNIETAEEMVLTGDDIVEYVEEKTQDVQLYSEQLPVAEIINLNNLVNDFQFVRETLRENTENGRRVLNSVTLDLLDTEDDKRASLIMSFAELNKAIADNMKLYIQGYKEISNVLLNLDKIQKAENAGAPQTINNTLNINSTETISTVDLIKRLTQKE
jgi:hypothetical protein